MEMINTKQKFEITSVIFKNRIVMAPMVPFHLKANDDGSMSAKQIAHYSDFASRGMGLIISQSLAVSNKHSIDGGSCVYDRDLHEYYLREIVQKCHENKVQFFAQLAYPSISYFKGGSINDLSTSEIVTIREEFIKAALICEEAGCDGIELHGANGFFLNMITSDIANSRSDQYGGSVLSRARLIKEIIEGIKKSLKDDFLISFRFGCSWDLILDLEIINELVESGLDFIHICSGIPHLKSLELSSDYEFNQTVYTASFLKKNINIPIIAVSDIRTMNRGDFLLENKVCDLVAYGRPFLADKNFIMESMKNPDYKPCFNCKYCFWYSDNNKCPAQRKLQNIQ
ncbi:NADH:flavin oxidoreductase [Clostridium sp. HBUAS56010]|uniref:oxidoreductase n=1 Tax=Clostridium sp. HBUAS56010 TaxID=2571127 RepID=UPI001177C18F|nr:NADH:flavin oxidoreductase [Clostridium sp. HBUAS56010]